jgi:hypothetical protein
MLFWLFQANSKHSQVLEAIQMLVGIYWLVKRYTYDITPDDGVLIWIAGPQARIYSIAEVEVTPQSMNEPPDINIWTMLIQAKARFYAPVTFRQKLLDTPLLKLALRYDRILYELEVIHCHHNPNFQGSEILWHRVITLIHAAGGYVFT